MSRLRESDLDDYSRLAVSVILAQLPEWEHFARLMPRPDGASHVVDFNVPCPSRAVDHGLWVSTADEELSVGFHTHHSHFTDYDDRLNPRQIEAGVQQAADVLAERVGVVSWYRGSEFAGSRWVELPHEGPLPRMLDGLGASAEILSMFSDCDRATLRSWLGHFNRDEPRGDRGASVDGPRE